VPEETNRKIVDHISDINLTYSDIAREYLLREGLPADRIIKTGSPMFEVLNHYLSDIHSTDVIKRLGLEKEKFFVVSSHREENINNEKNFSGLIESLNLIADQYHFPIIVSTHPRTKKMIAAKNVQVRQEIQFLKPLGFNDYNALQMNSFAVLSDSGTISEESSILNFPALNIREAHERPEAMEEAAVMMVGLNPERIMQGLTQLQSQKRGGERNLRRVADYSMPNVSEKVVRIILSYVDYVKRVVWSE
jgi:UDP-N-acetylglucosamine 2-epimerase (non-hydrolysing)